MNKSRLLYFALLTGLVAAGSLANDALDRQEGVDSTKTQERSERARAVIRENVEYVIVKREALPQRVVLERIPDLTTPVEGAAALVHIPAPTAAPRKRQDAGQIQALSGQIQQLSVSFSSASSASQSISQSAQQVQQSADQASRDNSQALSRTQSSASSAVAQASQQANDRVAQASSSMSSQISRNLASVQSSANSAVNVAQASASLNMASAVNVAMSQIQAARAEATAVRSDANNFTDQVQRNAISTTNLAIIVATSVSGAVILTSIIVCVFLRYRRKRREARGRGSPTLDEKGYDKPIAVRGSVRGSRFNPFNGGNYPLDKLKLPSFNTRSARKDEPLNFGFALSDYSDLKEKPTIDGESQERVIVENSASTFRLQRPPSVKSVEAIRVIRVNSRKEKEQPFSMPGLEIQPAPTLQQIKDSGAVSEAGGSQSQFTRKPVTETSDPSLQSTESDRKSLASTLPDEGQHESKRFTTISGGGDKNRSSSRYTMISTASFEPPSANNNNNKHYTVAFQSEADEALSWRPPSSRGNSRANSVKFGNTAQRLAFRDSGDPIPEPDATGWKQPKGGFSMVSVSSLMRSDSANMDNRQPTIPKLPTVPRQGPSFAAFPTVRNGTPGVANRPRPALAGSIREDAAERRTEKGKERATQPNGNVDGGS